MDHELEETQRLDDDSSFINENDPEGDNPAPATLNVEGKLHDICFGITSIGRHPSCQICIDNPSLSRHHAIIHNQKEGIFISHCSKSSFFVQKFNFDFPRKLSIFLGEKLVKMLRFWAF